MKETNSALAKPETDRSRALVKKEAGLTLVKAKETRRRQQSAIKNRIKSVFSKITSVANDGRETIKKGTKSSAEKAKSVMTGGQDAINRGGRATLKKTESAIIRWQVAMGTRYYAIKDFFKKRREEEKKEEEKDVPYGLFAIVTLVILFFDRGIFFGEHEGQLTTGWVGFCLGWFARDRTTNKKAKLLMMILFGLFAIIKWLFLLL